MRLWLESPSGFDGSIFASHNRIPKLQEQLLKPPRPFTLSLIHLSPCLYLSLESKMMLHKQNYND